MGCSGTETPCHQGAEPAHGPGSRFNLYAGSRVCPPVGRGAHRRRGGGLPCPRPAHGLSAGQGLTQTALHPPGPHTLLLAAPAMRALETALVLSALLLLPAEAQNGRRLKPWLVGLTVVVVFLFVVFVLMLAHRIWCSRKRWGAP